MSSKFVRIGDSLVNVDDISAVVERGKNSEIYMRGDYEGIGTIPINKTLDELLEILNGQEPSYDWIPCSERLPKQEEQVFVYLFGNSPYIAWYNHINKKWRTDDFELDADEEPKAWLPLPMLRWGE